MSSTVHDLTCTFSSICSPLPLFISKKRKKENKVSISVLHDTYAQSFLDFSDLFLYAHPCCILYLLLPTGFFQHFTHVQFSPYKQSRTTLSPPSCLPFYLPVFSSLSLAKLLENLVYTSCLRISISQPRFKPLQLGFSHLFTQTLSTRSSVTSLLPNLWAPFNCLLIDHPFLLETCYSLSYVDNSRDLVSFHFSSDFVSNCPREFSSSSCPLNAGFPQRWIPGSYSFSVVMPFLNDLIYSCGSNFTVMLIISEPHAV